MYNVLLVDDEPNVLKSLQLSIPWQELGLVPAATASSAAQALQLMDEAPIDIVISDICMPDMDGLTLCRSLLQKDSRLQVIIISGFAEFEYAKQAIALGVKGYCLKPIDAKELCSYLRSAVFALQKSDNAAQEDFIDSIYIQDEPSIAAFLSQHGLSSEHFYMAVSTGMEQPVLSLSSEATVKLGTKNYLYLSSAPYSQTGFAPSEFTNDLWGIGYSHEPCSAGGFAAMFNHCLICSYQYFITGKSGFFTSCSDSAARELIKELSHYLHQNNQSKFIELLQSILSQGKKHYFNVTSAYLLYNSVLSAPELSTYEDDLTFYSFEPMVSKYGTFQEMLKTLISLLQEHPQEILPNASFSSSILQILAYLNENYAKDISLQSLSDEIHLSKNYISQLFKKETGFSYSGYLEELRIRKSKELLQNSDLPISKICEATGFNDYFYFIKVFKKAVGCTPNQYRTQLLSY